MIVLRYKCSTVKGKVRMTCTFDDFEREEAMNNLGDAVYDCNMDLDEFMDMFIASGMAREYEYKNPTYVLYIS